MVESHASAGPLQSSIEYTPDHHFPLENIPFGVFQSPEGPHCCTRIGDQLIDLAVLESHGLLNTSGLFNQPNINKFVSAGSETWHSVRVTLQKLFSKGDETLMQTAFKDNYLFNSNEVKMLLPIQIGDYTDFYSSKNHAYNVGVMVRGPDNALQPNWLHLPVGYHGRASSVVVSGTDVIRPKGQVSADNKTPSWSVCKRLDFELEVGAVVGKSSVQGHPVKVVNAPDHIFGFTLLNDWSARDIQFWEYVPLGPFNAKNFATTISPWIVTCEALEPFKVLLPEQKEPEPLPYLRYPGNYSYDVQLDVLLKPEKSDAADVISRSNFKYMYWSAHQQLAHHTVTGCNLNVGDLLGSGTISGTDKGSYGSLLELCWGGKEPIKLSSGEERTFLVDGDTLTLQGYCKGNGYTVGFGDCSGKVFPALGDEHYF